MNHFVPSLAIRCRVAAWLLVLCWSSHSTAEDPRRSLATGTTTATAEAEPIPSGVIIVRPAAWAGALKEWKAYRAQQGHEIFELDSEPGRVAIQAGIVKLVEAAKTRAARSQSNRAQSNRAQSNRDIQARAIGYVLLVGDSDQRVGQPPILPTWYRRSTAMVKFGGDEQLATDNPYADIDGDERPDLAIGRIPADTPEQVEQLLARSIAYEQQLDHGLWRRDVRVIAGVGGFGALADSMIELTTSKFLTDRVPAWCDVSMTYASPSSPYCPDPFRFSEATQAQLDAGSQFWVYIGHGHVKHLDYVKVKDDFLTILDDSQIARPNAHQHPPIAMFLACYTGAFDAREDCLSEKMIMHPGGPVAAISATRVTGPYGLATLASGLLDECFVKHTETLGDAILSAKQKMLLPDPLEATEGESVEANVAPKVDAQMKMITAIASALSPSGHDLLGERQEHVWQVNLLGDPLLRLHHLHALDVKATPRIEPGQTISINAVAEHAGKATVELSWPRDKTQPNLFTAGEFTTDAGVREQMQASYAQANNRVLQSQELELTTAGPFACDISTAASLPPGRYVIRIFIEGRECASAGAADIQVTRARAKRWSKF